jgi:hypothetical protein
MFRVVPRGEKLRILPVSTRNDIPPVGGHTCAKWHLNQTRGKGEGVKGHSRLAGAPSAALEALALSPAQCVSRWVRPHHCGVSRSQGPRAFQFHGSLDPGIIVLRYVTLYNGRNRAVRPTPRRPRSATAGSSSAFPVRPDCSVAVAARGADVAGQVVGCSFTNASAAPSRLFSAIVPSCTLWILSSNTRNGVASNGTANRPVQVVSVADYGLA